MAPGALWADCRRFWCTGRGKARWKVKGPRRAQNAPGIKSRQKKGRLEGAQGSTGIGIGRRPLANQVTEHIVFRDGHIMSPGRGLVLRVSFGLDAHSRLKHAPG